MRRIVCTKSDPQGELAKYSVACGGDSQFKDFALFMFGTKSGHLSVDGDIQHIW
jgi:hypothetical protein